MELRETEIGKIPTRWKDGELFVKTILKFIVQEKFILEKNLNERTITHKLAEHIKDAFTGYDVDCEYNKMGKENVDIDEEYVSKRLNLEVENTPSNSVDGSTVFPDIIVHHRGLDGHENNYLIIEVKKKIFADKKRPKSNETHRDFDKRKLSAYTNELKYQLGIYLEFNGSEISELSFIIDLNEAVI
jgi:hypothetical protein